LRRKRFITRSRSSCSSSPLKRLGGKAARGEFGGQFAGAGARAHEDQRAGDRLDLEEPGQRRQLVRLVDEIVALLDGGHRDLLALDRDRLRVAQVALGQAANFGRHSGREERRLARAGRGAQNRLDVLDEAHAQHLVGLVEHDAMHLAQVEHLALDQVEQAARRADDDIDALLQAADLAAIGFAAVDGQHAHIAAGGQVRAWLWRPARQLTRRRTSTRLWTWLLSGVNLWRIGRAKAAVLPVPVWA
jgi:hypothetical protein